MQDEKIKTISFRDLKWTDVNIFRRNHGFKDLSPFVEYCVSSVIYKKRNMRLFPVAVLLSLALLIILLVIVNMRI